MWKKRVLRRAWSGKPVVPDEEPLDRLISDILNASREQGLEVEGLSHSELEMAQLIAGIRAVGAEERPLPESQIEAVMAAMLADTPAPAPKWTWRDWLGALLGHLACGLSLALGLILLDRAANLGPGSLGSAILVASVVSLASLLLFPAREAVGTMKHQPSRWPLVLLVAICSCISEDSETSSAIISRSAITIFQEGDALWGVRDIVESDGVIWTLTESAPFLRAYDRSGSLLAEFGHTGDGPGELRNPWSLLSGPSSGTVTVWDLGSRRLSTFTTRGVLVSAERSPTIQAGVRSDIRTVTFGDPFRISRDGDALLVVRYENGLTHSDDFWGGQVIRVAGPEQETDVLIDLDLDLPGAANRPSGPLALAPVPLWDRCPDGRIAVLDPLEGSIHLFDASGQNDSQVALPWQRRQLLQSERIGYLKSMMRDETRNEDISEAEIQQVVEEALSRSDVFATGAPLGVDLRCSQGTVWIQEFDGTSHPLGYGQSWWTATLDEAVPRFQRVVFPRCSRPIAWELRR